MTDKKNIPGAEKSAKGGRVLANAKLGFGQNFIFREIQPGTLEMSLTLTVTSDALIILSDTANKAIGGLLQEGVEGTREKILAQKRAELANAMQMLRVAIISEKPESIFDAGIQMEELRAAAASYGGFLDSSLSAECSEAMADALTMLRYSDK
jgi:hypothetical protein